MEQVDARGLSCPEPVLMTKEALSRAQVDELEVLVDTVTSRDNVLRMGKQMGWEGSVEERSEGTYAILFRKRSA